MIRGRIPVLVSSALLLAGCAASGDYGAAPVVPTGSEIVLHQRLAFGDEPARVYLQDGQIVPRSRVDRVRIACALRLRRRGDEALMEAVEPGRFLVIDGGNSWTEPARIGRDRDFPNPPRRYEFNIQVEIRSDQQPQVDSLHCSREDWRTGDLPTLAGIERALGEKASIRLPTSSGW